MLKHMHLAPPYCFMVFPAFRTLQFVEPFLKLLFSPADDDQLICLQIRESSKVNRHSANVFILLDVVHQQAWSRKPEHLVDGRKKRGACSHTLPLSMRRTAAVISGATNGRTRF